MEWCRRLWGSKRRELFDMDTHVPCLVSMNRNEQQPSLCMHSEMCINHEGRAVENKNKAHCDAISAMLLRLSATFSKATDRNRKEICGLFPGA